MPIFEYRCRACGHGFEAVVLPSSDPPICPSCGAADLDRLVSGFAVSSESLSRSRIAAARKRKAASKDFNDQRKAETEELREHVQEFLPPKE